MKTFERLAVPDLLDQCSQPWSWSTPNSTHFECIPYQTHRFQVLKDMQDRWSGGIKNCSEVWMNLFVSSAMDWPSIQGVFLLFLAWYTDIASRTLHRSSVCKMEMDDLCTLCLCTLYINLSAVQYLSTFWPFWSCLLRRRKQMRTCFTFCPESKNLYACLFENEFKKCPAFGAETLDSSLNFCW